ncbi:MAG TPA: inositol monophosphatase family protein [Candidatus Binataceae bacterium]|nr:inositol monophosphatase family protein [Candidatus Binataceae bacterium]
MDELQAVALKAARAAGKIHLARFQHISIASKSNFLDLVTEADREAEARIIAIIGRAFPGHAILAEESGLNGTSSEHRWIIDPLDGTTNFAHGYPQFCVSIGYERRGKMELGVVYDASRKEMFVARRGGGATLNGAPIAVSNNRRLNQALLGTGFPYDRAQRRWFYLMFWETMMPLVHGIRRTGAAALDLSWVACGRLDGFWEFGLKPWDVAAGALIIREAGGRVTNLDGSPLDLAAGRILAANRYLHGAMRQALAGALPEAQRRQDANQPA